MSRNLQKTLASSFTIEGVGLHTGAKVDMECLPADANSGIRFVRIDLDGQPVIPANLTNVHSTFRGTTLRQGDAFVNTTEHILSAFYGMGIDNATIHLNGPEIPILDGSARFFVEKILDAGIKTLEEEKEFFECPETVQYISDDGCEYLYQPSDDGLEVTCIVDFKAKVGQQVATYDSAMNYGREIAPARTFVFANEIETLLEKGIIKGGNIDSAIVFSDEGTSAKKVREIASKFNVSPEVVTENGILNGKTLYFTNEPARHKLLDIIGDLSLLGKPLKGKITARRPGHTGNFEFAMLLKQKFQKHRKLKGLPHYDPSAEPVVDIEGIKKLIPHRFPFLLVDKIIVLSEDTVVGIKNVTSNEQFFQGHFPDNPVFPGVLQMEALAQTGGILALTTMEDAENWDTYFLKMEHVRFKKIVRPGDTLILKMQLLNPIRRGIVHMQGTAYVGDSIVSEGELTAQIIKRK